MLRCTYILSFKIENLVRNQDMFEILSEIANQNFCGTLRASHLEC